MKYAIYYGDYEYLVEQNYLDILDYEFTKTFYESYDPYYTLYNDKQKTFVKAFEYNWLHNNIHEYDYYTTRNYDFLTWLKNKYESAAEEVVQYLEDSDPDDWWDSLDDDTKYDIMDSCRC